MSTAAAIPWIQYSERVVAENSPDYPDDVTNRAVKFLITQSDFAADGLFPGFLVRHLVSATPEGSLTANVGQAAIDTTGEALYIKMSGTSNTGWVAIGGNLSGDGTPEAVVTADIGKLYEQRDAGSTAHAVWYKASGTGNTGWRKFAGFIEDTDNTIVITGTTATFSATTTDSIVIGNGATVAAATAIAIGKSAAANGSECISIGGGSTPSTTANMYLIGHSFTFTNPANIVAGSIFIGKSITHAASTNAETDPNILIGKSISIGTSGVSAQDGNIVIGNSITVTGASDNDDNVIIGNGFTLGGSSCSELVAIGKAITTGASGASGGVVIGSGANLNSSGSVVIGAAASNVQSNNTIIGANAQATTASSTVCTIVGQGSTSTQGRNVLIGQGIISTVASAIVLGTGVNPVSANSANIVDLNGITTLLVGKGDTSTVPQGLTFRLTNAADPLTSNVAGGSFTFTSGVATGNAASGSFIFKTGDAGASSTTLQSTTAKFTISPTNIQSTLPVYINDTSNASSTLGLTINQGANDDEILSLKSSDVAHGMTSITETDSYGVFGKAQSTGGVILRGFEGTANHSAFIFQGAVASTADTTKSTAARGVMRMYAGAKSGTTIGSAGANTNLLTIEDAGTTRFIFDADGDSHQDVGTSWTNFDTHDDVALLNKFSAHVTRHNDPLRESFGGWLKESKDELEKLKLVTFNDDGHHFINMSRLSMLHTGAIRQLGEKLNKMEHMLNKLLPAGA